MITLKNLRRNNNYIVADFYSEDYPIPGRISVDIKKQELVCFEEPKNCPYYTGVQHAVRDLIKLRGIDPLPQERKIIWY